LDPDNCLRSHIDCCQKDGICVLQFLKKKSRIDTDSALYTFLACQESRIGHDRTFPPPSLVSSSSAQLAKAPTRTDQTPQPRAAHLRPAGSDMEAPPEAGQLAAGEVRAKMDRKPGRKQDRSITQPPATKLMG
jgi:hypothetical protein